MCTNEGQRAGSESERQVVHRRSLNVAEPALRQPQQGACRVAVLQAPMIGVQQLANGGWRLEHGSAAGAKKESPARRQGLPCDRSARFQD
jgi:hypothetical protein